MDAGKPRVQREMVSMWVKSSYSYANGACVEVWRKSRRSWNNGACVEAGQDAGTIAVRDSAMECSPILKFDRSAWTRFVQDLK